MELPRTGLEKNQLWIQNAIPSNPILILFILFGFQRNQPGKQKNKKYKV